MDAAVTERAPQTASPSSSSFAAGTGSIEFGSLGELSPCWWEPEDGSAPEPWLSPDEAFERFLGWCEARGIELWDHQEEALMDLAAGDHVIPVSYTHLDVYKRQLPGRSCGARGR